jgi:hypothetical protein
VFRGSWLIARITRARTGYVEIDGTAHLANRELASARLTLALDEMSRRSTRGC